MCSVKVSLQMVLDLVRSFNFMFSDESGNGRFELKNIVFEVLKGFSSSQELCSKLFSVTRSALLALRVIRRRLGASLNPAEN